MAHITLVVTEAVLQQVNQAGQNQRQIAIRDASPELLKVFNTARSDNRIVVAVNGAFELSVGDTDAIWAAHQAAGLQAQDFMSLYDLLARRPGRPVRFAWE